MRLQHLVETARGMYHNRKGMAEVGGAKAVFITLVTAGIIAMIGLLIFSQVDQNLNFGSATTAVNDTVDNIRTTVLDAYDLAVVGLIVLAAVFILGIVFLLG